MISEIILASINIDCSQKWDNLNSGDAITRQEFQICKSEFKIRFIEEYTAQYSNYLGNDSYCSDKWREINYRRNPSLAEKRLCKDEFEKYKQKEIKWKKDLLKARKIG